MRQFDGFPIILDNRNQIPLLLNDLGLKTGVEVGVLEGGFSESILSKWKCCEKLYMVDVWRHIPGHVDFSNQEPICIHASRMVEALYKVDIFYPKAVMIRETSMGATDLFRDGSLDFVYLDAAHDYANVTKDLNGWFRKIKRGGLFMGHDFLDLPPDDPHGEFGVRRAVVEFAKEWGLKIQVTDDPAYRSWIMEIL